MLPGIGPMELIVVLVIALIVFGPKKLPTSAGRSALGCGSSRTRSRAAASATPASPMPRLKPIHHEEQLPVVDHLDELRSRLMVAGAAFLVAFGLTTWQSDLVLAILNAPLPGTSSRSRSVPPNRSSRR